MLLRPQLLFALLALSCSLSACFLPFWEQHFSLAEQKQAKIILQAFAVREQHANEVILSTANKQRLAALYPLPYLALGLLLSSTCLVCALVLAFSVRSRTELQAKLAAAGFILTGLLLALCFYLTQEIERITQWTQEGVFTWGTYLLVAALVFILLLRMSIQKAQKLLRDTDRLR